jgi:hypothetical protein
MTTTKKSDLVRTCETCGELKVTEHFARDKRGVRTYECWACRNERMKPHHQRRAAKERAARLKELGLPQTATDEQLAAAESAAFSAELKAAGPLALSTRIDLKGVQRRTAREEARYQQLRGEQRALDLHQSELRAALTLTDEQIDAMPEHEREYQRQLRSDARDSVGRWRRSNVAREAATQPGETVAARLADSLMNPTPARIKAREQQKARNARRDPHKARLSTAKNNLRRALETAKKQAARRAYLLAGGEAHCGNSEALRLLARDEWLNQQAQARWRAEIETLENTIAGASQVP